ncbi:MAG TPA: glycosyl hydrolase, partial [Gemmatimonadaceae bacterium]
LTRTGVSRDSATRLVTAQQPAAGGGGGRQGGAGPAPRVPNQAGMNTFAWNLRYPDAERFSNLIMWAAGTQGPVAPPGTYSVRMTVGTDVQTHPIRVRKDPRSTATDAELQEQFQLLIQIRDKVTEANNGVRTVRNMRWQVADRTDRLTAQQKTEFARLAGTMMDTLTFRENEVYQTRNQSGQDPLNYPIKLNNKIAALSGVVGSGEFKPTNQSREAFTRLSRQLDAELAALKRTMDNSLPALNAILRAAGLPELKPSTEELPPRRNPIAM